VVKNRRF